MTLANNSASNGGSLLDWFKAAGQTAVDIIGAKSNGVTSTPNSGINPAALNSATVAQEQERAVTANYTPLIIGGVVLLSAVVVIAVVASRKG